MRLRALFILYGCPILALLLTSLRAEPGDVENSHDYSDFPRQPGFVISDYDEDNPAEFDFPVARPLPEDADRVVTVHAKGHRYVIRYEMGPGARPGSLLQAQQYYEKLAASFGYTAEKTGAVGDVNETFHRVGRDGHDIWAYLQPAITITMLTIVESSASTPPPANAMTPEDALYTMLMKNGRVVLPVTFLPGKPDLESESQSSIDRVIRILQRHTDLQLTIEGHTDDTGEVLDNRRLSSGRARAVQAMIVAGGIDRNRLDAVGMGGTVPIADNETAEGRQKNRRIELVIQAKTPATE